MPRRAIFVHIQPVILAAAVCVSQFQGLLPLRPIVGNAGQRASGQIGETRRLRQRLLLDTGAAEGAGVGLAICSGSVQGHGGRMGGNGEPRRTAQFTFILLITQLLSGSIGSVSIRAFL